MAGGRVTIDAGRCAGMVETTGHRCRARPIHGTAWCVYHHPFHNAVEAIGGPWDGDWIAGPGVLGGQAPVVRRVGAPGNAAWRDVLGLYELTCTRGRIPDPRSSLAALQPSDRLWFEWMPARALGEVLDARHGEGTV